MAVQFEFYKNLAQKEEEGETSYHPRVVNPQHMTTRRLTAEIHLATTFGKTEMKAMLMELSRCMGNHLRERRRVYLDGVGYFQITSQAAEPIHPMAAHADKMKSKSVNFLTDRGLRGEFMDMHTQRSEYRPYSTTLSQGEVDKRLTGYFSTRTVLARSDIQSLCRFTRSMAARHIRRLKEEGSLQNIGIRTQPIYVPCPGHYRKQL